MAKLPTPTLAKSLKDMKKDIFAVASIDSTATYAEDGLVTITPTKASRTDITNGSRVRQRGVLSTNSDGTSLFVPYNTNLDTHRYNQVFSTLHGLVYTTQKRNVVVKLTIQSGISQQEMARIIRDETNQMITFIKSTEGKEALK